MSMEYIGFVKYEGKGVEDGIFDARKSAQALLGFDQAIKYFVAKEEPVLLDKEYELPVEIKKDSWDIFLPVLDKLISPEGAIGIAATTAATTYITKSAAKAATDGFFEIGLTKDIRKVFKAAFESIQWVVKIAKHIGSFKKDIKIKPNLEKDEVEIINSYNNILVVPKEFYERYKVCPENILDKLAQNVDDERILKIGVFDQGKVKEVKIDEKTKYIFYSEEKKDDINDLICPELEHGEFIEIEGVITKVNEKANTMGFQYKDYILTIEPEHGNVTEYKEEILSDKKEQIFRKVKIQGIVSRLGKNGEFLKKPRIIFTSLMPIEEDKEKTLFD